MTSGMMPSSSMARPERKPKAAVAVADVEDDAALARRQDLLADRAVAADRRVREGSEAVGQHVARAQHVQHLVPRRRRVVDVRHHRQAQLVGHLDRQRQRRQAGIAAGLGADARLDADDDVRVLARRRAAFVRVEQPHVGALADHHVLGEGEDAGKRDVDVGQDARPGRLDHVLAEAGEIACAGAAGVDEGRRAAAPRDRLGVDAQRGAAPVDVRVQVDQPRRDDPSADVAHLARPAGGDAARRARRPGRPRRRRRATPSISWAGSITRPPFKIRSCIRLHPVVTCLCLEDASRAPRARATLPSPKTADGQPAPMPYADGSMPREHRPAITDQSRCPVARSNR